MQRCYMYKIKRIECRRILEFRYFKFVFSEPLRSDNRMKLHNVKFGNSWSVKTNKNIRLFHYLYFICYFSGLLLCLFCIDFTISFLWVLFRPVRIRVRIGPPHPLVCRKRWLNGVVLRMRPENRLFTCTVIVRTLNAYICMCINRHPT
jgi:hypothetical protein